MIMMNKKLINNIVYYSKSSREELAELIRDNNSDYLFLKAVQVTERVLGKKIHIRGIIEFSNYCRCACHYCGIRSFNKALPRYRLEPEKITEIAREAVSAGYKSIVLQSGEDSYYDADKISKIIRQIKELGNIAVTLSVGERSFEEYSQWKKDGADRYLLKHETADKNLYGKYHPFSSLEKRINCLKQLKTLGYQTGSGFMVGLPGQTADSLADDILLLKELDVDMAGIGVFIPHPATPLAGYLSGDNITALKCVALTRILLKRPHLPITTSITVNDSKGSLNPFCSGANVVMKKVEPYQYQKLYEIYPNTLINDISVYENRKLLEASVQSYGYKVSEDRGDAILV